jgi:hypothetical protein
MPQKPPSPQALQPADHQIETQTKEKVKAEMSA